MAVSKETKQTIEVTIEEVFKKMNSINWIDRNRIMQEEAFKNTEKLLYGYNALIEHLKNEDEYLDMVFKGKSKSIVSFSKNSYTTITDEQIMQDRLDSYKRSQSDVSKITKALDSVRHKKGFKVIELRYLQRKADDEIYTYEEIADILKGTDGYNSNLNEKTVRLQKNKLVKEIAILLFGSDAI